MKWLTFKWIARMWMLLGGALIISSMVANGTVKGDVFWIVGSINLNTGIIGAYLWEKFR